MLRFNTLLEEAHLDPRKVFLLRHKDSRLSPGRIFSAWLSERKSFESYQEIQKWKNRFPEGSALASYIVNPRDETLFVGIYDVVQLSRDTGPYDDPLLGKMPPEDRACHITKHSDRMLKYEEKLIVDWGSGRRQWRQRAHRQNKDILSPVSRLP
jgi:hypothetical protein